ncbi:unnamed protein product [Didymodactylos carnosus]|uniref:Uncharacterized protein n=1 Tax=Didymodactylos carnosus TaxID=1234261 RepID=A0A815WKK1_9BILA|nr:unnamed protein product [Didymodactylos carnosus]CAF1545938.1 unnamed protein product [Didymodactylos carnosus]CAF4034064.1 unnamed protein product [Didymodactylos carnosus]CAF4406762.1 unnamed protein product [Didymodactylos carnosus]
MLLLFITEHKIQLSIDLIFELLSKNLKIKSVDRIIHLIIHHTELLLLIQIFESAIEVVDEQTLRQVCITPFGIYDNNIHSSDQFYTLLLKENFFYQLPSGETEIKDDFKLTCSDDPFLENCLMNLIEMIVNSKIMNSCTNINHLLFICSRICQNILNLLQYGVNNLEKLRSFCSLIRCISSSVIDNDNALSVLQQTFNYDFECIF